MSKQERTRKSAPQNKVKSFSSAPENIKPSADLDSAELARFQALIGSRESDTWVPADIELATHLAKLEVERDQMRDAYRAEGPKLIDHNGKQVVNPLFTIYNALLTQSTRLRRDLGLSASQRGVSGSKQKKRNLQDSNAKSSLSNLSSLINRPNAG